MNKTAIALALSGALIATPASAHGFWPGFAAGAALGLLTPGFAYGPPVVYAPPPVFYPPPVAFYPPGAPTFAVPQLQPDPVIRHVQAGLNALGFGPLNVDGFEGPATYNAICAFQSVNGLVVDGIAGSGTLAVLDTQLRAIVPPHAVAPSVDPAPAPAPHDDKSPAAPTVHQS